MPLIEIILLVSGKILFGIHLVKLIGIETINNRNQVQHDLCEINIPNKTRLLDLSNITMYKSYPRNCEKENQIARFPFSKSGKTKLICGSSTIICPLLF